MPISLPQIKEHAILVFLQNAWSPLYAGGRWPRKSWLKALELSRSGQRLKLLVDHYDQCENTTPIVGPTASSVVPTDVEHIRYIFAKRTPRVIIACGKQAEEAMLSYWNGALLVVPHPACRVLTNDLYVQARRLAGVMTYERMALRQFKDGVRVEFLDGREPTEILRNALDNRK